MHRLLLLLCLVWAGFVTAQEARPLADDPVLEAKVMRIAEELRCLVCQNETIDESNADIAKDMRLLLRTRILAGDSNEQVIQFLVSRYGDYVLLKPRFMASTYLLWFGPFIVLLLGAVVVYRRLHGTPVAGPAPLSPEEKATLEELAPGERTP